MTRSSRDSFVVIAFSRTFECLYFVKKWKLHFSYKTSMLQLATEKRESCDHEHYFCALLVRLYRLQCVMAIYVYADILLTIISHILQLIFVSSIFHEHETPNF